MPRQGYLASQADWLPLVAPYLAKAQAERKDEVLPLPQQQRACPDASAIRDG